LLYTLADGDFERCFNAAEFRRLARRARRRHALAILSQFMKDLGFGFVYAIAALFISR